MPIATTYNYCNFLFNLPLILVTSNNVHYNGKIEVNGHQDNVLFIIIISIDTVISSSNIQHTMQVSAKLAPKAIQRT